MLEKAAGQGHAYAMDSLGSVHDAWKEHEKAAEWYTKGAEAGLPRAMHCLGCCYDLGEGVALDYQAAVGWYRRAAEAGHGAASAELAAMYNVGRGVTRSKREALRWRRKAADTGHPAACMFLAQWMYADRSCAREFGQVGEVAGIATSAEVMAGHDIPPDVLTDVVHWLRKGGHDPVDKLQVFRRTALEGAKYCVNSGCEVVGHLKDFKVCPQCNTARYCGDACQQQDWTTGGHKATCGTFATILKYSHNTH